MLEPSPVVGIIMGSTSDWDTMRHAAEILERFGVPHESKVVSAHRTPTLMAEYASAAAGRGLSVIIAGAGGAAHRRAGSERRVERTRFAPLDRSDAQGCARRHRRHRRGGRGERGAAGRGYPR